MQSITPSILIVDPCAMTRQCLTVLFYAKSYPVNSVPTICEALSSFDPSVPTIILHEAEFDDGTAEDLLDQLAELFPNAATQSVLLTQIEEPANSPGIPSASLEHAILKRTFSIKRLYSTIELLTGAAHDEMGSQGTEAGESELTPDPETGVSADAVAEPDRLTTEATTDESTPRSQDDPVQADGDDEQPQPRLRIGAQGRATNDAKDDERAGVAPARTAELRTALCARAESLMNGE